MRNGNLPGLAVLVQKRGYVQLLEVLGRRAIQHEVRAEIDDVWHLGSDTKAMTAFLLALAVQEGRLSYASRVADLMDNSKEIHPLNRDLTVADLLVHGGGLHDVSEVQSGRLWREIAQSARPLMEQRRAMTLASLAEPPFVDPQESARPLRSFKYGNINYIAIGSILEKVYASPWENLMRQRVFGPLDMRSCGFGVAGREGESLPSQPWPHIMEGGRLTGIAPVHKFDNPPLLGPAGTVHCRLQDWRKFIAELIAVWNREGQLLKEEAAIQRYFTKAPDSAYTYGGWMREDSEFGTPVFRHNGSNTANFAVARFAPERNASVLLATNSGTHEAEKAINDLAQSMTAEAFAKPADGD